MADWGLLGALRGRNSWSEIKAEKQRELQYQTVLNQMQQDENASLQQKQAAMQEYLNTDMTVLKRTVNGNRHNMTLREFRERVEADESSYDQFDFGGCACALPS